MQTLLVRLSEDERRLVDGLSAAGIGSRAAVIRQGIGLLAGRHAALDPERNRILTELARAYVLVGVNLNQLARPLNTSGDIEAAALGSVLSEIIALNDRTRRALQSAASSSASVRPATVQLTAGRKPLA